jgi:5-formyltetrahydrofolate cyclo-ligase
MNRTDKRTLRKEIRAEIAKLSADEKLSLSAQIFSKIATVDKMRNASVIALFVALPDEPQTSAFIEQLLQEKKRVVVPRIEGDEMNFYEISEGVAIGAYNIMEPLATIPVEPREIDAMIVPGVAFTREGARLGRGKGFYDKYLSHKDFRAYTIGVCYPCQVVEDLPSEPHDKIIDEVIYG